MRIMLGNGGTLVGGTKASETHLDTPKAVYEFWREHVAIDPTIEPDKENLVAILVGADLRPTGYHLVSVGTLNANLVHPREIFRAAVIGSSYGVVLCHNHPSGDPSPSAADCDITNVLRQGAELLQIRLVDHVVIGTMAEYGIAFCSIEDATEYSWSPLEPLV